MGISMPRLVFSGLVAGFVVNLGELGVNVWLLGDRWREVLASFGVEMALPGLALWGMGSFILGIVGVWIYVAVRPRYPSGISTAFRSALALWAVTYLYVGVGMLGTGMLPGGLVVGTVMWGLVEMFLAVYVGAWLYRTGELAEA
jgi:hypothetical protein